MKKLLRIAEWWAEVILFVVAGFGTFVLLTAILMTVARAEADLYPIAYVDVNAGSTLNVRKAPGGDLAHIRLNCREDVIILDQVDGWALVIRPHCFGKTTMDGQPLGWASMDYLVPYRQFVHTKKEPAAATADPSWTTNYLLPSDHSTDGGKKQ